MAGKSDYFEGAVLDWALSGASPIRPTSRTVKLFTANPADAGAAREPLRVPGPTTPPLRWNSMG